MKTQWNERELTEFARMSFSRQAVNDVKYGRFIYHHTKGNGIFCAYSPGVSFILCYILKDSMRIIGMATAQEHKRNGFAGYFLSIALEKAKQLGKAKLSTRTTDGFNFYAKRGFVLTGKKGDDFLMEYKL